MSDTCPITNKVIEYLFASVGEEFYSAHVAFEFFHASAERKMSNLEQGVVITRCLDDPDAFLIGSLANIEVVQEQGQDKYVYEVRPVGKFLEFIGLPKEDVPVFDLVNIGPFNGENTLKILEIVHACYTANKELEKAQRLRDSFVKAIQPSRDRVPDAGLIHGDTLPATSNVVRPDRWHRPL